MQHFQPDPRRYYPDAQEQSILIPYLKKYFDYPERSPERNLIAAEVSNMLSKLSSHWTHRAVRLWFNNNRGTYIKDYSNNIHNASNNNNKQQNKQKVGLPSITNFVNSSQSSLHSSLPSIDQLVNTSLPPRSASTSPNNLNFFINGNNNAHMSDDKNLANLVSEANNLNPNEINKERLNDLISQINRICNEEFQQICMNDKNVDAFQKPHQKAFEFPHRSFITDPASLLNLKDQIWKEKNYYEEELPKIDFYAIDSGIDSFIIDNSLYVRKDEKFIQITDKIPHGISCYTTSYNFVWATTLNEIYQIPIRTHPNAQILYNHIPQFKSSFSKSSDFTYVSPFNDSALVYTPSSSNIAYVAPDLNISNICLYLSSPISQIKCSTNSFLLSMKNNVIFSLHDVYGTVVRYFIGHMKEPNQLFFLDNDLVVSSSKDSFIDLWDISVPEPIFRVKSHKKVCRGLNGNRSTLITCYDDSTVNVMDIRQPNSLKPLLGFEVENSNQMTLSYDSKFNSINFFLEEMRPQAKLKYVYRTYPNVL